MAENCKECGKELSFISKRLFKGLCRDCFNEETKPYCKECGKKLDSRTYRDVCPDCLLEENKRQEGYCKECGKKLPVEPALNWDKTEYLVDLCSDCEFVRYLDGKPLANKPIDLYYHFPGGNWQFSNTVYTGADGKYSSTTSSSKTVILQTGYKVGGVYVASSNVVTITVH